MSGWHDNLYSYLLLAAGTAALMCALYVWWRAVPNSRLLVVFKTALCVWLVGYGFEIGLTDLDSKVFWSQVQYLGIVTVPVTWFAFAMVYTGRERWLTPRAVALLAAVPLVTLALVWTDGAHGLIWDKISIGPSGIFLSLDYGPWFWVHAAYSYFLALLGAGLIVSGLSRSIYLYHRQSLALLVAVVLPLLGNVLYVMDLGPLPNLDLTPFAFLLSAVVFFFALIRYRLLDVGPVARDAVVDGMDDGVLVIDPQNRIVDVNPAARRILGLSLEKAIGRDVFQSLDGVVDFPEDYRSRKNLGELKLGDETGRRCYESKVSPLESSRGNSAGYLVTLHDVTEQRRIEEKFRKLNESLEQRVEDRTGQLKALVAELQESERKLRLSEERFRSLVQNASDIIMVLEADGSMSYESPSVKRILGYEPQELLGENIFDYVHQEDREQGREFFELAKLEEVEGPRAVELRFRHADGTWRCLEAVGTNLTEKPSTGGVLVNSRDVTVRKQMEESLQESLDMLLAVYKTGQVLNSTLEPEEVGTRVLEIMQSVANLTSAVIARENEKGELGVWHSVSIEELWDKARFSREAQEARMAAFESQEYQSFQLQQPGFEKVLNALCLPLKTRERTVGVLEVYGTEDLSKQETLGILSSLAAQIAGALENARLYQELAERERRMRDLVGRVDLCPGRRAQANRLRDSRWPDPDSSCGPPTTASLCR